MNLGPWVIYRKVLYDSLSSPYFRRAADTFHPVSALFGE